MAGPLSGLARARVRSRHVRLDRCQINPSLQLLRVAALIEDSDVAFSRMQIVSMHAFVALCVRRSRCVLLDSAIVGGPGEDANCYHGSPLRPATPGADAVAIDASILIVGNSSIVGGAGGRSAYCLPGAAGGAGLSASAVLVLGPPPRGGAHGTNGAPGSAYILSAAARLHHDPGIQTPLAWLNGVPARGQTVHIEVRAAATSLAVIAFSYSGLTTPLEPWGVGSLLAQPALVSAPFQIPTSGAVAIPLLLPASMPLSEIYTGQVANLQPVGVLVSNAFALVLVQ